MPLTALLTGLILSLACGLAAAGPPADDLITLRARGSVLQLSRPCKGALVSLSGLANSAEFCAPQASPVLFRLCLSKRGETGDQRLWLTSAQAGAFVATPNPDGVVLQYSDFPACALQVTCTVRCGPADPLVRWRLSARVPDTHVLEEIVFPIFVARAPLGERVDDDAFVAGNTKGGIVRRPGDMKPGAAIAYQQPGSLAAEFACYYNPRGGVYTAALDPEGTPKDLRATRTAEGLELSWDVHCFASGAYDVGYDTVLGPFSAPDGSADWRDAADIYKAWALTQPWCRTRYADRADIPAWMKAGPSLALFDRSWLAQPEHVEQWIKGYLRGIAPDTPLVAAYWGWEKHETWVTPDYFPVFPSDEQFTALNARLRPQGVHAFCWPSGYHWTLTFDKRADGSFAWDDRERFDRLAAPHAIRERTGGVYAREAFWLRGGVMSCMCPGDPWTLAWFDDDICAQLSRRGCEVIQVDQVVGGSFPFCYSPEHGHPPGPGPWMTRAFERQLTTMRKTCAAIQPQSVIGYEEPNERFNHLVGIQDYRDCEAEAEWASVFSYLYHEYLPTFQSNPRAGDLPRIAHCFADGQMPRFIPHWPATPTNAPVNGDFEQPAGALFAAWDKVSGWQGEVWTGKAFRDDQVVHGGKFSLRLENAEGETVQVSQNLTPSDAFSVGRKYRLSAWLRTGRMTGHGAVAYASLTDDLKGTGASGALPFPPAGAGWTRAASDFVLPPGTAFLRIMIHVVGAAQVWVDDVLLEEINPDGTARPVVLPGVPFEHPLMSRWAQLYHGEGRPYLCLGRMLHPPKLEAGTITYRGRPYPAIVHNAFRAADGSEAVILVNATNEAQQGTLHWQGRAVGVALGAQDAALVR